MNTKELKLSADTVKALRFVRDLETDDMVGVTAATIKAKGFEGLNASHLTSLMKHELVTAVKVNLVCNCCGAKRKVNAYKTTEKGREIELG